jgi:hypothetical protein
MPQPERVMVMNDLATVSSGCAFAWSTFFFLDVLTRLGHSQKIMLAALTLQLVLRYPRGSKPYAFSPSKCQISPKILQLATLWLRFGCGPGTWCYSIPRSFV